MEKEKTGNNFGLPKQTSNLERMFKGSWVSVQIAGFHDAYGVLKSAGDNEIVLNPHYGRQFNSKNNLNLGAIKKEDAYIALPNGSYRVFPETEKSVKQIIKSNNESLIKSKENKKTN